MLRAAFLAGAVALGVGISLAPGAAGSAGAAPYEPGCGGDQVLNPEYGSDYGYHPRCVDTTESGVPGATGPDGYTPCTGDLESRLSRFCSDPNGSY